MIFKSFKFFRSVVRRIRNVISTTFYSIVIPSFGNGSKIFHGFYCPRADKIQIGENCLIDTNVSFVSECPSGFLILGNNVKINTGVTLDYSGGLEIKDNVVVSRDSYILTHSHGYDPHSKPVPKPLTIESDSWVGAKVIVGENVSSIGSNSVVASGSVVTKNVDNNSIVGGNPAKFIKSI